MTNRKLAALAVAAALLWGCGNSGAPESFAPPGSEIFDSDGSYALGMSVGMDFMSIGVFPDIGAFIEGLRDALMDNARYTMEQALEIFETAYAPMLRDREATFLEGNALRPGVAVTESGLQFEIIFEGEGPNPDAFSTVLVHYEGYLIDGTVFDSSLQRGDPEQFHLPSVIPGWAEGLQLMNVGAVFRFFIPYDIGYGPQGVPGMPEFGMPGIPPYATLIFDVELLEIVESAAFDW